MNTVFQRCVNYALQKVCFHNTPWCVSTTHHGVLIYTPQKHILSCVILRTKGVLGEHTMVCSGNTLVFTVYHCESSGNWQRCDSTASCHRCHTNVHIRISQHCHYHCCPSAVTVSAATLLSAPSLSDSAVLVFTVTTLWTSVSNRCGIPPQGPWRGTGTLFWKLQRVTEKRCFQSPNFESLVSIPSLHFQSSSAVTAPVSF